MTEEYLVQLERIAPLMNELRPSQKAEVFFDLMSGALVWTDEVPHLKGIGANELHVVRFIWHYRTDLILGQPEPLYLNYWLAAERLFPRWPGFEASRRSAELRTTFVALKEQSQKSIDDIF